MSEMPEVNVTILVIEDDPGDFNLVKTYLRLAGLCGNTEDTRVLWATTLTEGLAAGRRAGPDVVLLDLSLPDSFGLATVQAVHAALPQVPIVVLTGQDENQLALATLESGAQDFLVKGHFNEDVLGRAVRHARVRSRLEQDLAQAARLYAALSRCNQAIVHCADAAELLLLVCNIAVESAGMRMAWIGEVEADTRRVRPVACHGAGADVLQDLAVSVAADQPGGQGPVGTALREDRPVWCQDFLHDPAAALWHEHATDHDWLAVAALPLHRDGAVGGVFVLHAATAHAFDAAARKLFAEMTSDISFALDNFARQAERIRAEESLRKLSHFDALTGLANRSLLSDRFEHALGMAQRSDMMLVLMVLDLDHFKNINDTLGRHIGDALLVEVARRIQAAMGEEDTVSRQGGDEFILLLPTVDASGAAHAAEKLLAAVAASFLIESHELTITPSIGIASCPADGTDLDTLSRNADVAMYRAKQDGRNCYRFFAAEMQLGSARTLQLESALRRALERGQLSLHYQPQQSLRDGCISGAEALLRWQHPDFGMVSPAEFIPIAEVSGQMVLLGEWVLRTAVRQMKVWLDAGLITAATGRGPVTMAVNLSVMQFRHPRLTEQVMQILTEEGLPAHHLELELTEGVALNDPLGAIAVMNALHGHGIRMSIDDFGTGYSSLSYLKQFKVYKLKIDQSFVRDISEDPDDKAIVSAVISMARSLGLQTIAEGVETAGQLAFLRASACDEVQGYLFSRPLPRDAFEDFLRQHSALPGSR